jgi:hypothetical protein
MKNILTHFNCLSQFLLAVRSLKKKRKKGFEYNRTQKEVKKTSAPEGSSSGVPVDLDNKGIGPIDSGRL